METWFVTYKEGAGPFDGKYLDKTVHESVAQAQVKDGRADWYMCVLGAEPDLDALNAPMTIEIGAGRVH